MQAASIHNDPPRPKPAPRPMEPIQFDPDWVATALRLGNATWLAVHGPKGGDR